MEPESTPSSEPRKLAHMVEWAEKSNHSIWDVVRRLAWRIDALEAEVAERRKRQGP